MLEGDRRASRRIDSAREHMLDKDKISDGWVAQPTRMISRLIGLNVAINSILQVNLCINSRTYLSYVINNN